jgi:hypothetical protein
MDQATLMLLATALEKEAEVDEDFEYIGDDELSVLDNISIGDVVRVMNSDGIEKEAASTGEVVQQVVNALKGYATTGWGKAKGLATSAKNLPSSAEKAMTRGTRAAMPSSPNLKAMLRAAMVAGPAAGGAYYVGKKGKK